MYNGQIGNVGGGNDNVKWSKQLADILDKADGTPGDGKIDQSVWNAFLKNSNANNIEGFITTKNAEKSFDYYKSNKDIGNENVDWSNWKQMLNVYLDSIGRTDLKVEEDILAEEKPQVGDDSQIVKNTKILDEEPATAAKKETISKQPSNFGKNPARAR